MCWMSGVVCGVVCVLDEWRAVYVGVSSVVWMYPCHQRVVLQVFEDDHERQYIYKEPTLTTLGELTLRLQKLYTKSFGADTPVHIIHESGKVRVYI